jgi:hypothetical protein
MYFVTERPGMQFRKSFLRRTQAGIFFFTSISITNTLSDRILGHSMRYGTYIFWKNRTTYILVGLRTYEVSAYLKVTLLTCRQRMRLINQI